MTLDKLKAWVDRHKEDADSYILNTFLTVGDLRNLVAYLEIMSFRK